MRVLKILERIGGRTVYLALLNENATALRRLVALCEQSQFLTDQIAAQPLLLDELIDERLIEEMPTRAQFAEELALRRQNMQNEEPERQVELLREFQSAALFRVAVADLIGGLPLMKVSDRLTDIAELIVQETLVLARSQIEARHGVPRYTDANGTAHVANMIVVAYGKLGGLELGYGSDLDLVFLHDSSGEVQRTDGAQPIDNTLFFQRLGQRLVHLLTVHSASVACTRSTRGCGPRAIAACWCSRSPHFASTSFRMPGRGNTSRCCAPAQLPVRRSCASSSKARVSRCCAKP